MRAIMQAVLDGARIHVQIDIGFGDALTPPATELTFPTLRRGMPSPNVLAYAMETIVAEASGHHPLVPSKTIERLQQRRVRPIPTGGR